MRNLKRALSLTLASVMLLGMMVVGSSAASYPDVEDTHNVEAIEVLKAVKVMVGDDNGNFGPDDQVNRAQMAVVMALLLDLDYDYYKGTNPFWDVPSWAEPYVAACYANGIVSGYNATTYGAGDPVTAVQAASMMMRALGYFKYQSDYKDGFELSTVRQASKIGLFKDVNAAGNNAAMTRNQVAQLALNTLETPVVDAKDNTLNISGESGGMSMSVTGGQVDYIVRTSSDYKVSKAIEDQEQGSTETDGRRGFTVELGEQLYQGDLKKDDDVRDDFGRPSVRWQYKANEIGVYAKKADLVQTWTAKVTKDAMYKALGAGVVDDLKTASANLPSGVEGKLSFYVDGVLDGSANGTHVPAEVDKYANRNNTGKIHEVNGAGGVTGNGSVTEVYVDNKSNVTIVVTNTYVFQAASDFNESKGELKVAAAGDTADFIRLDNYTLKDEDFDLSGIKEDDYLLITVADTDVPADGKYEPKSVATAELVTGAITAYSLDDSVTVDGTKYSYSVKTNKNGGVKSEVQSTGGNVGLVMDKYGYVIAVDDTVVGGSYVFITDANNEGNLEKSNIVASAYFSDGTDGTITLKKVNGSTSKDTMKAARGWYSYSKDADNKYTLTSPRGSYRGAYNLNNAYDSPDLSGNSNKLLTNGSAKLFPILGSTGTAANGATNVRANEKTIFVVVDKDGDVTAATGVSAAPDIEVNGGVYDIGYVWNDKTEYATYVFISTEDNNNSTVDSANETNEFIFLTKLDSTNDDGTDTYYTYKAIKDGVETKVYTDDNSYPVMRLYSKVKYDHKNTDRITSMKEVDGAGSDIPNATDSKWHKETGLSDVKVDFKGNVLTIGNRSFTVKDSDLNMVVLKGAGISNLKVNSDQDADYVVYANEGGSTIRATLDGFAVSGYYYVVTTKDYSDSPNNNQYLDRLYLYVSSATDSHAGDEDAAETALKALDDNEIGVEHNGGKPWTPETFQTYLDNEIRKVTKNVSISVEWPKPFSNGWTAATEPVDKDTPGTPGTFGDVKVTIKKNDGTDQLVTLTFSGKVGAVPYEMTAQDLVDEAKDALTNTTGADDAAKAKALIEAAKAADTDTKTILQTKVNAMLVKANVKTDSLAAVKTAVAKITGLAETNIVVEEHTGGTYTAPGVAAGTIDVDITLKATKGETTAEAKVENVTVALPADEILKAAKDAVDGVNWANIKVTDRAAADGRYEDNDDDKAAVLAAATGLPTTGDGYTIAYTAGTLTPAGYATPGSETDGSLAVASYKITKTEDSATYETDPIGLTAKSITIEKNP